MKIIKIIRSFLNMDRATPPGYMSGWRRTVYDDRELERGRCWTCRHVVGYVGWTCKEDKCHWEPCYRYKDLNFWEKDNFYWVGQPHES